MGKQEQYTEPNSILNDDLLNPKDEIVPTDVENVTLLTDEYLTKVRDRAVRNLVALGFSIETIKFVGETLVNIPLTDGITWLHALVAAGAVLNSVLIAKLGKSIVDDGNVLLFGQSTNITQETKINDSETGSAIIHLSADDVEFVLNDLNVEKLRAAGVKEDTISEIIRIKTALLNDPTSVAKSDIDELAKKIGIDRVGEIPV